MDGPTSVHMLEALIGLFRLEAGGGEDEEEEEEDMRLGGRCGEGGLGGIEVRNEGTNVIEKQCRYA